MQYFKTGEFVSVEAGINGFIVHTDEGSFVAGSAEQMLGIVMAMTTNHAEMAKQQQAANEAEGQDAEIVKLESVEGKAAED